MVTDVEYRTFYQIKAEWTHVANYNMVTSRTAENCAEKEHKAIIKLTTSCIKQAYLMLVDAKCFI